MRRGNAVVALLAALSAGGAVAGQGVAGTVMQAPGCPGPQRLGQAECANPVQDATVELRKAGAVVASARTGADGSFALDAPAGKYRLAVVIEGVYPRCPEVAVSVRKGKVAQARIDCDSGMR